MAMAGSNGLPVLKFPDANHQQLAHRRHNNLFGLEAARVSRRATSAAIAGLKRIAESAGSVALPILEMRVGRSIEEPDRWWLGLGSSWRQPSFRVFQLEFFHK